MRIPRQLAACLIAAAVAGGAAVAPAPALASVNGPEPVTTWLAAVEPGEPTWVNVFWTAGKKICDVRVTVRAPKVDVRYPSNTGDHSSFSQTTDLRSQRVDHTAIQVTARHRKRVFVPLTATITYTDCGRKAVEQAEIFRLTLPVLKSRRP